jgi:N-acetylmuramoyl-L-alanine amidase
MKQEHKDYLLAMDSVNLMARTIYGEARGESTAGQEAVANVIINRLKRQGWYGKTVHDVILKPYQFSCWLESDPNFNLLLSIHLKLDKQVAIACKAVNLELVDNTNGATHYHTKQIKPSWTNNHHLMQKTIEIGNHIFYKEL